MSFLKNILKNKPKTTSPFLMKDVLKRDIKKFKHDLLAMEPAIATDLEGIITYWSNDATQLFGYEETETVGQHISLVYFDKDKTFLEKNVIAALKSKGNHELTLRLRKKSNQPMYCRLRLSLLLEASGKPYGMIGFTRDITQQMQEEEERKGSSDQKYREIFETVPVSIWEEDISELRLFFEKLKEQGVTDIEAYFRDHPEMVMTAMHAIKVIDINDYTVKLYKVNSKEELINQTLTPFISEDAKKIFISELVAIWNEEEIFTAETTTNNTLDGDVLYLNMMARIPSIKEPNKPMLVCIQDLTENRFAENALRKSEEKYRSVVDATSEWIWEIDVNRRIIYSNDAISGILAYSTVDIFNTDICDFMHEEDAMRMKIEWPKIINEKKTWNIRERRWIHSDGSVFYLEGTAFPIYDSNKNLIGYRGLERDVTERKLNGELLSAAKKLAATGELAARIAHEINNPLAGIKSSFQLVKQSLDTEHKNFKYVELIDKEIDRIANIVRQMYGLYKKNASKSEYFNLEKIIHEIIFLLGSDIDKKIKYEVNVSSDTNELNYPEASFRQILFNFIGNAVDAYDTNGVVYINSKVDNGFLYLCVADNGRGIEKKHAPRIFEPFFSTKDIPSKGLGLGLSTCKNIVESLGGNIEYIPDEKYKTEFKITLPLAHKD